VLARPAVRSVILGARTPDYPYGERGQTHRNRRISGGRF
jgi:hypothetical protein